MQINVKQSHNLKPEKEKERERLKAEKAARDAELSKKRESRKASRDEDVEKKREERRASMEREREAATAGGEDFGLSLPEDEETVTSEEQVDESAPESVSDDSVQETEQTAEDGAESSEEPVNSEEQESSEEQASFEEQEAPAVTAKAGKPRASMDFSAGKKKSPAKKASVEQEYEAYAASKKAKKKPVKEKAQKPVKEKKEKPVREKAPKPVKEKAQKPVKAKKEKAPKPTKAKTGNSLSLGFTLICVATVAIAGAIGYFGSDLFYSILQKLGG